MRTVVSWGYLGYPWVSWGNQTDPTQLSASYSFHKNLLYFLSNVHLQSSRPYK